MTAPTNPAPLPVVACEILEGGEVITLEEHHLYEGFDRDPGNALAVPLALFEDYWFRKAVYGRAEFDVIDAIAAELRERAEKGVGDA
jgi:hypothetical protein